LVTKNTRITTLALLIAMAVALHWAESFIPRPAPFLRIGLANIFTMCALYLFGGLWGILVASSRVIIGSLLTGSLFTPSFFFSFGGGIAAGITMWIMPKKIFSMTGVSVAGALSHMSVQIILAMLLIRHRALIHIVPLFLVVSVITGIVNGYCASIILKVARERSPYLKSF